MCHEDKPAEAFAFQSIATGERSDHCRECHAAYRRQHYLRNKPTYIENERLRVRGHRLRNRDLSRRFCRRMIQLRLECDRGATDLVGRCNGDLHRLIEGALARGVAEGVVKPRTTRLAVLLRPQVAG